MASQLDNWINSGYWSQFKKPKSPYSVDPFAVNDSAYGDRMIHGSASINADPMRNIKNASYGAYGTLGQYGQNPLTAGANPPTGFSTPSADAFQKLMQASTSGIPDYDAITGVPQYARDSIGQPFSESVVDTGFLSDKIKDALSKSGKATALAMAPTAANILGQRATGTRLGGNLAGTAAATGVAAAQEFANPAADMAVLLNALRTLGIL